MDNNNQLSSTNSPKTPSNVIVTTLKPKYVRKKRTIKLETEEQLNKLYSDDSIRKTPHGSAFSNRLVPYSLRTSIASDLLNDGKSLNYVSKYTGLDKNTVIRIKRGEIDSCDKFVNQIKKHESQKMTFLSNEILDSVNQTDLTKASLLQKVTSASILIDKRRLLDGESTENVNYLGKLDVLVNNAERSRAVLDKIKSVGNK